MERIKFRCETYFLHQIWTKIPCFITKRADSVFQLLPMLSETHVHFHACQFVAEILQHGHHRGASPRVLFCAVILKGAVSLKQNSGQPMKLSVYSLSFPQAQIIPNFATLAAHPRYPAHHNEPLLMGCKASDGAMGSDAEHSSWSVCAGSGRQGEISLFGLPSGQQLATLC